MLDWFRRERGLADLSTEEVRAEEMRLGIREKQAVQRMETLDAQRKEIFGEGAKERSTYRRRQLARRFQMAGFELRVANADFGRISKELVTLGAIRHAIERRDRDAEGKLSMLSLLRDTELARLLEDDRISYEVYLDKLNRTVSAAEGAEVNIEAEVGKEGSELLDIWSKMDEGAIADLDEGLKKAEETVTKRMVKEKELE